MKLKIAAFAAAVVAVAAPAKAEVLTLPLADFWANPEYTYIHDDFKFRFGESVTGSKVTTVTTKRVTNAWHKADDVACHRALASALIRVREYAQNRGGTQVQGLKSGTGGFNSSSTEFTCDKSHFKAVVNLTGFVVK